MAPFLGATGIGVSNMEKSLKFYRDTLNIGLAATQTFDVEAFTETVLGFPRGSKPTGSQVILMQYKDGKTPLNQQGKLVFYVDDVKAVLDRCKAAGAKVYLDLGAGKDWVKNIAMVHDPDGFLVEFLPLSMLRSSGSLGQTASKI
jgi:catechol 2,3-dioxygenase-like lactoylglutathione lyase family enzyme